MLPQALARVCAARADFADPTPLGGYPAACAECGFRRSAACSSGAGAQASSLAGALLLVLAIAMCAAAVWLLLGLPAAAPAPLRQLACLCGIPTRDSADPAAAFKRLRYLSLRPALHAGSSTPADWPVCPQLVRLNTVCRGAGVGCSARAASGRDSGGSQQRCGGLQWRHTCAAAARVQCRIEAARMPATRVTAAAMHAAAVRCQRELCFGRAGKPAAALVPACYLPRAAFRRIHLHLWRRWHPCRARAPRTRAATCQQRACTTWRFLSWLAAA